MKLTIPTTNHKTKQKCVETVNLSEDNWCKPLLSFITKTTNITEISNTFFTVPSLISSPRGGWSPPGKGHPVASPAASYSAVFIPSTLFCTWRYCFFFDPYRKGINNSIVMKQYMVTGEGIRSYKTDDGEPMMASWALVKMNSSTFPHALAVPSSRYRFTHLSREKRVSPWPAVWIPHQAASSTYSMFAQQTVSCQRSYNRVATSCWMEEVPSTERLSFFFWAKLPHLSAVM